MKMESSQKSSSTFPPGRARKSAAKQYLSLGGPSSRASLYFSMIFFAASGKSLFASILTSRKMCSNNSPYFTVSSTKSPALSCPTSNRGDNIRCDAKSSLSLSSSDWRTTLLGTTSICQRPKKQVARNVRDMSRRLSISKYYTSRQLFSTTQQPQTNRNLFLVPWSSSQRRGSLTPEKGQNTVLANFGIGTIWATTPEVGHRC